MFLRYRAYDIDNPWFLSFSYNTFVEHISTDQFMAVRFPAGMDGTQLFGKLAALLQYAALSQAHWQQLPAAILSSTFVVFALGLWQLQLRKLGYSATFQTLFVLMLGLSEPCLSAANKSRYEFLSFALISLGLLLTAYAWPLLGMFVAGLAVEVEPMALAGVLAVAVLAGCTLRLTRPVVLRLSVGLLLALAFYLTLHPHSLSLMAGSSHAQAPSGPSIGGFFVSYFLVRPRHLPELLFFVVAAVFYWRGRDAERSSYFAYGAIALALFAILMPHGNPSYMIFAYPFFVGIALTGLRVERAPRLTAGLLLLYTLPQYAGLTYLSQGRGYRAADIQAVSAAIQSAAAQLQIPDGHLRIYGDYRLWYAHPHLYRAASEYTLPRVSDADLYLCFDHQPDIVAMTPQYMLTCSQLAQLVTLRPVSTVVLRNNLLHLYARQ